MVTLRRVRAAASALLLSAGGCDRNATTNDSPSRDSEPPTGTATGPSRRAAPSSEAHPRVAKAQKVLQWLADKDYARVRTQFDSNLAAAFPTNAALRTWWIKILVQTGPFHGVVSTHYETEGSDTHVVLTSHFTSALWDVAMVFDAHGKIGTLAVRPPLKPIVRSQTPTAPFPYTERPLQFTAGDGNTFAGTLTVPKGDGPHPAVILVSGSGPHDRDARVAGHRPFFVIADHLTRQGIAVLRYDDRGVAESQGDAATDTLEQTASDAEAALTALKAQPDIDAKRAGVIGHSVGGMVAPAIAQRAGGAFVVSLAGPVITGAELIPLQVGALRKSEGHPAAVIEDIVAKQRVLVTRVRKDADNHAIDEALRDVAKANAPLYPEDPQRAEKALYQHLKTQIARPWYASFAKFDPEPHLRALRVPMLLVYCEKDVVIPAQINVKRANTILADTDDSSTRVELRSGLNHLFQTAQTGAVSEYAIIDESFAPAVLQLMSHWLRQHVGLTPLAKR